MDARPFLFCILTNTFSLQAHMLAYCRREGNRKLTQLLLSTNLRLHAANRSFAFGAIETIQESPTNLRHLAGKASEDPQHAQAHKEEYPLLAQADIPLLVERRPSIGTRSLISRSNKFENPGSSLSFVFLYKMEPNLFVPDRRPKITAQ